MDSTSDYGSIMERRNELVPPSDYSSDRLGYRHFLAVLVGMLGFVAAFFQAGVSEGIVSMTTNNSIEVFDWSSSDQSAILSSYSWGLLLGSLPAGYCAQVFDVKLFSIGATLLATSLSSLVPWIASASGWQAVCALVTVQGFCSGIFNPAIYIIISRWATTDESTTLLGIAILGTPLGSTIALPLCGYLASSCGWPYIFYSQSILGIAWSITFFILGASRPTESWILSESEKEYILVNQHNSVAKKALRTPWRKIITSRAVIVLILTEMCYKFGSVLNLSELPLYIQEVLKLPILLNGIVSALPVLCILILVTPCSWLADYLSRNGILSRDAVRKLYTFIGLTINGVLLILCGMAGDNTIVAMSLLCLATASATFELSGCNASFIDLAPNFVGVLMAITSICISVIGILAPNIVGLIVKDSTVEQWQLVFLGTGLILIFGGILYVLLGSTSLQSWNAIDEDEGNENEASVES